MRECHWHRHTSVREAHAGGACCVAQRAQPGLCVGLEGETRGGVGAQDRGDTSTLMADSRCCAVS